MPTRVQEPEFQNEAGPPPDQGCGCSQVDVPQEQVKREHGEAILFASFHCTYQSEKQKAVYIIYIDAYLISALSANRNPERAKERHPHFLQTHLPFSLFVYI